ncbi:hypothetical protein HDV01_000990 [Terramyces sp. JEL0728]|nr:hypothetical protein HDV01_000990 [Terramyces sp. JEL0728]
MRFHAELKELSPILFSGKEGSGKSSRIYQLAKEYKIDIIPVNARRILTDESLYHANAIFSAISNAKNSIIHIESLDFIHEGKCLKEDLYSAMVLSVLSNENSIVIAETRNAERLSPVMKSWFKHIISVNIGNIFEHHKEELKNTLNSTQYELLKSNCKGFNHYDFKRLIDELEINSNKPLFDNDEIILRYLKRNTIIDLEIKSWNDIGGYKNVKNELERGIIWKFKHPDKFRNLGILSSKGTLLYGPPGNGKTLFAKCLAGEAGTNFIAVSISRIIKGEVGESEKAIQTLFEEARSTAPSIIFFDEVDAFFTDRTRDDLSNKLYSQLVSEIDHLNQNELVSVLAATNHMEIIAPSLIRPGRIDRLIHVDYPNEFDRKEILCILFNQEKLEISTLQIDEFVIQTVGMSCADLNEFVRRVRLERLSHTSN